MLLEFFNKIPETFRKQFRRMLWVAFVFILVIQAASFFRTGQFYDFKLKTLFGL